MYRRAAAGDGGQRSPPVFYRRELLLADDELKNTRCKIIGVVALADTNKLSADVFHVQTRLEQHSAHPINTRQLLSPEMEKRGQLAQTIHDKSVKLVNARSGDFADPDPWK